MHRGVVTAFLLLGWVCSSSATCPDSCDCQPEGRGQSVVCRSHNLSSIITQLLHNTARLKLNGATLHSLSRGDLEEAPKSIQHLTITNTSLHRLEVSAFSPLTALQELDLSGNDLRFISEGAFAGLSRLRLLNLSGNDIDRLGSCLEPLVSLQQLDLSNNFVHKLHPSIFHAQSSLRYLRLDGNEIQSLGRDAFEALSFLTELRIQNCSISAISESFLSAFPRVRLLDLSNNRLNSFPSSASSRSLRKLQHLYINDNRLLELQAHQFDGLRLMSLSLAGNRIGALRSDAFAGLTVRDLDISQNTLMELNSEALQPVVSRLMSLNLANNPIRVLHPEMFTDLGNLETLNISACSVGRLSAKIFSKLYNLRTLDISRNRLQNISEDLITVFNRLVRVNVQDNLWHCDCHILPFTDWLTSRRSMHKLFCPHRRHPKDCSDIQCASPGEFRGKLVYNLSDPKALKCGGTAVKAGLSVPVQISIVLACLLVAFGMLFLTMYLWRKGRTRKELHQLFKKKRKPDSHEEDDEEEGGDKIEPFLDCDNESLKESHRSFVFKHFLDQMVTDPNLLDPPSPSQADPLEVEEQAQQVQPKQKDSMYSSDPSQYETSHKSCSVVVVGIESAL